MSYKFYKTNEDGSIYIGVGDVTPPGYTVYDDTNTPAEVQALIKAYEDAVDQLA